MIISARRRKAGEVRQWLCRTPWWFRTPARDTRMHSGYCASSQAGRAPVGVARMV